MTTTLSNSSALPHAEQPAAAVRSGWAMAVPATLVVLLGFTLASVPARNSDVWRHLATGRALLDGSYTLGTDPFAYTTVGVRWINHAWLYDAFLFGLYQVAGIYLVMGNAVLVIVLAGQMLLAARAWISPWTAAFSVALALVAMGPYLRLEPAMVSYVLLAFALAWLRYTEEKPDRPIWSHWPLFVAVVLWANCDEWFVLGPAVIGLFWLGKVIASKQPHARLLAVFAVALVLCLVNAHHVHAFMLPSALYESPLAQTQAASPLRAVRELSMATLSVPLAAYLLLMALGLFAFIGNAAGRSTPQALIWLALAALSLYRASALPLFAVAAGPFLARGWPSAGARPIPRPVARAGPVLGTLALVALVVAAAPGLLQGTGEPRGWFVRGDASLQRLAGQFTEWRRSDSLPGNARGFNFSVDAAHYLEWYCPAEKVFVDGRPNLFPAEVIADFQKVRDTLAADPTRAKPSSVSAEVQRVLKPWGVTHLLVADPAERPLVAALMHLWALPQDWWPLIALAGRTAVFAMPQHAEEPPLPMPPPLHLARRALAANTPSTAPRQGGVPAPEPRGWWDLILWPDTGDVLDRDEALSNIVYFEARRPSFPGRNFTAWQAEASTAVFGSTGPMVGPAMVLAAMPAAILNVTRRQIPETGPTWWDLRALESINARRVRSDEGPPGALLLAIRAARRALHANPNDAVAYLRLGHAYALMHHHTAEQAGVVDFGLLAQMRRVQAISALTAALKLRPDLDIAHELLFALYERAGWIDLALEQLQQQLQLARRVGPHAGESMKDYKVRVDRLVAREQKLGKDVREELNRVDIQAVNLKPFGKAHLAESRGLLAYALSILQRSSYAEFGVEGAVLQLHLMLYSGHLDEVRSWLEPNQESVMGSFHYSWLKALIAAASGDYDSAHDALVPTTETEVPELGLVRQPPRRALGLVLGQQLLLHAGYVMPPDGLGMMILLAGVQSRLPPALSVLDPAHGLLRRLDTLANMPHQEADLHTLRGLLALEWGGVEQAADEFRAARAAWDANHGSAALARHYQALLAQQ
jgi:hypothetical protein